MMLLRGRAFGGLMLVIVVAFAGWTAALAIIIASQADQISEHALEATEQLRPVDDELDAIRLAERTNEISTEILQEVRPLSEQLGRVVRETASIDRTAQSIATTVFEINDRVATTLRLAHSIRSEVNSIQVTARHVLDEADTIADRFARILAVAHSIDDGVAGINRRAQTVIDVVASIARDFDALVEVLGPDHGRPLDETVSGHAHSIDCSVLLRPEPYCAPTG